MVWKNQMLKWNKLFLYFNGAKHFSQRIQVNLNSSDVILLVLSMEWFFSSEDEMGSEDFDYLLKNTGTSMRGRRFTFVDFNHQEVVYDIPEKMTRKDFDISEGDAVKFKSVQSMFSIAFQNFI